MIVKMKKVFVVARSGDRDRLVESLRDLGVMHLSPVDPARAVAEEQTLAGVDRMRRALQVLASLPAAAAAGEAPDVEADAAAREVLDIQRRSAERGSRLTALARQIDALAVWGDLRVQQFESLRQAGLDVRFYHLPVEDVPQIQAEFVHPIGGAVGRGRSLVAVLTRGAEPDVPDSAEPVEPPQRDRPALRAEAAEIDRALQADNRRLGKVAGLVGRIERALHDLETRAAFSAAQRGGLTEGELYAMQGWVPTDQATGLADGLARVGVDAGVQVFEPAEDETPPTLIRYPAWVRPIKGLFDVLGTLPGYREIDLSAFFMLALPIFAAMLIGDAGYGLLFVLVPALTYRKAVAAAGKPGVHLLIVMGAATMIWGVLAGAYFGVSPQQIPGGIGKAMGACQVIRGDVKEQAYLIMKISFVMAAIHLSLGQLRQALACAPGLRMLSKIGWAVFLWGVFFVVWFLFFDSQAKRPPHWMTVYLLGAGAGLAIVFAAPSRNPLKMIGLGLASFPLDALATFSDSISYIRLMGVGLASTIIAQTFNNLGADVASVGTWVLGGLVVLLGHGLNIAMCMIAVLAHGVRLNMLEFSNNAGVQWAGYAYEPFAEGNQKEL